MSRLFFIVVVFLLFVSIGSTILFNLGLMPPLAYSLLYQIEHTIPNTTPIASLAYLEKFEGHWSVALDSTIPISDIAPCRSLFGAITVHNGMFTGTIGTLGNSTALAAHAQEDGTLSGTLGTGGSYSGTLTGTITGSSGQGTWSDSADCYGTATFTKLDLVTDPIAGHIMSLNGNVLLIRNGQAERVNPAQAVYAGDMLQVPQEGGSLVLSLGQQQEQISVPAGSQYTVPGQ